MNDEDPDEPAEFKVNLMKKNLFFLVQGLYYLLTGLWPLIHIGSFMYVTGPKTDTWLVKMVGFLSMSIGASLIIAVKNKERPWTLSCCTALSFMIIDNYYALDGRISKVYLADAALELIFLLAVLLSLRNKQHLK